VGHRFTTDDARRLMVAQDHEHQILVVELLHERGHCIAPTSIGCHFDPIAAGATAMTEAADHHSCRYLLVPQRL
jgi:ribosomal protein S12 methylthiotransferase accessory factor YcaO